MIIDAVSKRPGVPNIDIAENAGGGRRVGAGWIAATRPRVRAMVLKGSGSVRDRVVMRNARAICIWGSRERPLGGPVPRAVPVIHPRVGLRVGVAGRE